MDNIVEKVKQEMIQISNNKMKETNYDDWNNHIRLVYENGHKLALERNADVEIVDIATILHDVARVEGIGPIEEHNKYGSEVAEKILKKFNYPEEKTEFVKKCIYNHIDNPKESVEEEIIADADVLAHFDNLSMLYYISLKKRKMDLEDAKKFVKDKLEFDFNKLSQYGKNKYKDRYKKIIKTLFGYNQILF
jgi:uncharacterized protein